MKKVLIIVTIITILVGMTGCGMVQQTSQSSSSNGQSLATTNTASVTTITVAVPVSNPATDTLVAESDNEANATVVMTDEVSEEEMWADLVSYAEEYLSGVWDGSEVYIPNYKGGKSPYAWVSDSGWLRVGSNWPVIPGVNLAGSGSITQLKEFDGWVEGHAWSDDYSIEYFLAPNGRVSATGIAPWNKDYFVYQLTVVDAEVYHGDRFDYALLREMLINGSWDGSRIWCPDSGEIIEPYMLEWGVPCGIDNTLRRFLALDEPLEQEMGYCDIDTMLTVAITKDGIGLYALDGSIVDLVDVNCDEREAFVAETSTGTCFVYDGRHNVYIVDFSDSEPTIKLAYQDIELWYGQEGLAGVRGIDQLGMEYFVLIWGDRDYSVNGLFG